ncbi:alpha/beta fold hydrolase [Actinomadura harenae]|uniref:Alpha/beta fold hydrolase n=1 Tax=Actinomadura harenae TaxID=2483351 RepID=A0A3M2M3L4_9ACTN|nr:alpha/beta fold hydrolase [Actinomadura harenae]RMI44189.1 alpha/beta fold hydrolase [Actinomadura harenae]
MPFAELGDVRLFFTDDPPADAGREPRGTLLLVHGYGADSDDWVFHLPAFTRRYRVIAPDLRGHGLSSAPAGGYAPRDLAGDLVRLLDHLGVAGPVVAIGHSLGAMVVSALAVEHPGRVRALVCVDPAYGQSPEVAAAFPAMCAGLRSGDPYPTALANEDWCHTPASPPWLLAWHRRKILATAPRALAEAFPAMYEGDAAFGLRPHGDAYLARRACPVLSCWSAAQADTSAWERGLLRHPASRSEVWPGGGHRLHAERPAEFTLVVRRWLDGLDRTHPAGSPPIGDLRAASAPTEPAH